MQDKENLKTMPKDNLLRTKVENLESQQSNW